MGQGAEYGQCLISIRYLTRHLYLICGLGLGLFLTH